MKNKLMTEIEPTFTIEELVLFTNDRDKNILRLNNDLK